MKKIFMRTVAIVLTFCFTFAFSVSADTADIIGDIINESSCGDFIEYDYVNKTYQTIPANSIPDYASITTTTYELDGMSAELDRLAAMQEETPSTRIIVDSSQQFQWTQPIVLNTPQNPYSGVVLLRIGRDMNNDGLADNGVWLRGTGFLVAPDVVVTAGHNVINLEYPVVEVRVYPYYSEQTSPSNDDEYIYPLQWTCSEYAYAVQDSDQDDRDYDWCVMKLQEPIERAYNFECSYRISQVRNKQLAVVGYPCCLLTTCSNQNCEIASHVNYYQAISYGYRQDTLEHIIVYSNNTKGGSSGSPVYIESTKVCYAIHTGITVDEDNYDQTFNRGTIINETIYNMISYYINLG